MIFSQETQGAFTYLVCELQDEQIDKLTLGMLTNNHMKGAAPVLYTENEGRRLLKYNISARISAEQFFAGSMKRERILQGFFNILDTVCSADEYMIDPNRFLLTPDKVYLNVSSCESSLICLPAASNRSADHEAAELLRGLLFHVRCEPGEDMNFITELLTALNSGNVTVYNLRELVKELLKPAPAAPVRPAAAFTPPAPPVPPAPGFAPQNRSNFNATISISDMPGQYAQPAPAHTNSAPGFAAPVQPQSRFVAPPISASVPAAPVEPKPAAPVPPMPAAPVAPMPAVPAAPAAGYNAGVAVPPAPAPRPAGNMNVAIPGRSAAPTPAAPAPAAPAPAAPEDKISFMKLMTHYNKQNAAQYKAQKAEAKSHKAEEKAAKKAMKQEQKAAQKAPHAAGTPAYTPAGKPSAVPSAAPAYGYTPAPAAKPQAPAAAPYVPYESVPAAPAAPAGGQAAPYMPYPAPAAQPQAQPAPVQNSFNDTVVLGVPESEGTALLEQPSAAASLTRLRTGEKACITKPVWRIGKERSYVDQFIGDNPAISRSHANIYQENGEYLIEDANSTNHTYVNGTMAAPGQKYPLHSGDRVRLANEDFIFST